MHDRMTHTNPHAERLRELRASFAEHQVLSDSLVAITIASHIGTLVLRHRIVALLLCSVVVALSLYLPSYGFANAPLFGIAIAIGLALYAHLHTAAVADQARRKFIDANYLETLSTRDLSGLNMCARAYLSIGETVHTWYEEKPKPATPRARDYYKARALYSAEADHAAHEAIEDKIRKLNSAQTPKELLAVVHGQGAP